MSKLGYLIGGAVLGALGVMAYNAFQESDLVDEDYDDEEDELDESSDDLSSISNSLFVSDNQEA